MGDKAEASREPVKTASLPGCLAHAQLESLVLLWGEARRASPSLPDDQVDIPQGEEQGVPSPLERNDPLGISALTATPGGSQSPLQRLGLCSSWPHWEMEA